MRQIWKHVDFKVIFLDHCLQDSDPALKHSEYHLNISNTFFVYQIHVLKILYKAHYTVYLT